MNKFGLEERTEAFSINILTLIKGISQNHLNRNLCSQLLRSSTSIGANYREANGAESKKDFVHKISICKKEARETQYWLRLLANIEASFAGKIEELERETQEMILIFSAIVRTSEKNN